MLAYQQNESTARVASIMENTTLSPYTTLFRSALLAVLLALPATAGAQQPGFYVSFSGESTKSSQPITNVYDDFDEDRKSTRLNSRHVRISHAVFCLIKKLPMTKSKNGLAS